MTTALLSVPQHVDDVRVTVEELFEAAATQYSSACDECGRHFNNRNAKRMHMVKTHGRIEAESDAFLSSRSRSAFKASCSGASNDVQQRFHCPRDACSKWFAGRKLLVQHYQKSHMEKTLRCEHCSNMFSLQRDLKYHLNNTCKALKRKASDEASADCPPATEEARAVPEAKRPSRKSPAKKSKAAPFPSKTILLIPVSVTAVPGRPILPR
ncbi:Zinc fingerC2H2 type family protein [Aphelenchoides avenae]|nr:Zinc fingerC2H2 type family protein [Aphelenchus avenae]